MLILLFSLFINSLGDLAIPINISTILDPYHERAKELQFYNATKSNILKTRTFDFLLTMYGIDISIGHHNKSSDIYETPDGYLFSCSYIDRSVNYERNIMEKNIIEKNIIERNTFIAEIGYVFYISSNCTYNGIGLPFVRHPGSILVFFNLLHVSKGMVLGNDSNEFYILGYTNFIGKRLVDVENIDLSLSN